MAKATYNIGDRHGSRRIVDHAEPHTYTHAKTGKTSRRTRVMAQCDCGAPPEPLNLASLKAKPPKGCVVCNRVHGDVSIGDRFDRWTIQTLPTTGVKHPTVDAVCGCGTRKTVNLGSILNGLSRSCGCWRFEARRTHGLSNTDHPEHGRYQSWRGMKWRTSTDTPPAGYEGVGHDPRWATFEGFEDHPPSGEWFPSAELCRTGDEGDYTPENCRWDTQEANLREAFERTAERTSSGEIALDVARRNNIAPGTYRTRVVRGWSIDKACSAPVKRRSD